jgi:type I restriction enzyme M protein
MARRPLTAAQGSLTFAGLDHRTIYREIRNYLAGQAIGATRDRVFLDELIKILFCKHYMDIHNSTPPVAGCDEAVAHAYRSALAAVSARLPHVFSGESFVLGDSPLAFIHGAIADLDMDNPKADLVGDAFELFTGSDARGQEGQFFTPHNAIQLLVDLVDPKPGETVIDPASGAGGFLSAAARRLIERGAAPEEAVSSIHGIDKDQYLAQLASTRLAFLAFTRAQISCADSLGWRTDNGSSIPAESLVGTFDVVLTNPPFGSRIVAATSEIQGNFDLGYRWKLDPRSNSFVRLEALQNAVPPQVLFIERSLSLVRPGGRVGIVVPESLISGRNYRHVVAWIRQRARLRAIIGMPEALFKTSGKGGTHTKTCLLLLERWQERKAQKYNVFMAETRWCGNDSRGRRTGRDELPEVANRWRDFLKGQLKGADHLGYSVAQDKIINDILAPRYYNPEVAAELARLAPSHELVRFGDLVNDGVLKLTTGNEVGAAEYGSGTIPFVRTSDISNWEIKLDPKHGVSEDIYAQYASKQDVRDGDILMVRDGTYLVGTCAYVTKYDTKIVFQSHIFKIRVCNQGRISPYLLLAALSSAPVRKQIRAKRFTQDIIDSLGDRIHELILPLPRDVSIRERVAAMVKRAIDERVEARELARQACYQIIGTAAASEDTEEPE